VCVLSALGPVCLYYLLCVFSVSCCEFGCEYGCSKLLGKPRLLNVPLCSQLFGEACLINVPLCSQLLGEARLINVPLYNQLF